MRESVLREEAENEEQERRKRGHFSKQPMCPVSPRRELFSQGFCAGPSGGLTLLGGAARVGKTATLRRLVGEWASAEADTGPEAVYPQFQFLFHFELEREKGAQPSSLQALVQSAYPHLSAQLPYLWRTPEALLLIFDGLDRLHGWHDASPGMATKDPTEGCPLPDVLWSLARGAMLPGCCVLFSGRPTALKPLENASPRLWLEVAGLGEGVRRAYALGLHRGQPERVEEALTRAQQNEYLWGLCADPGYCWLVCSGLGEGPMPRTATQVLAAYLHRVLRQRAEADPRDLLFRAGELALEGLSQRSGLFAEEDLRRYGLEPPRLEGGLIQRAPGRGRDLYAFCQPSLQEFVAALAQYLAPERRDLLLLLQAIQAADDGRYQGFLRCLLGLSARVSSRQLEEFLPPLPHRSICEAISWLEGLVQTEAKKRELSRHHLLTVAHYLHEGRNRRLARLLAASISHMKLGSERPQHGVRLDPTDCAALCYVFQHCESVDSFSFENCYVQAEGIKYLLAAFLNCKRISLVGNNLRDEGVRILCVVLRDPDCKVTEIELAKNNLTRACTDDLLSAIVSNASITGLSLNKNNLGDIGAMQLVEGLQHPDCKIEVLQLQGNQLTGACTQGLSKMILALSNLSWMILDHNQLGDIGIHNLCTGIRSSHLRRLGFGFNSLTDLASNGLVSALCVNRTIQFLHLTGNYFTQRSLSSFVTLIRTCQRLRKLWLGRNPLSAEDKQVLQAEQANRPSLKLML
ncbi:NACHT, LRR and PYD domains-containing protein 3-like [Mustelus asterias]